MMRWTAVFSSIVLVFSVVLSGCTTFPIEPLPAITDPQRTTETILIRERSLLGAAMTYYIAVNDKAAFGIRSGEHTSFVLPSGSHKIAVRCFGGSTPTWKETAMEYEFPSLKKVFFLVTPACVSLKCRYKGTCADIVPISESEAATLITTSTYRPFSERD